MPIWKGVFLTVKNKKNEESVFLSFLLPKGNCVCFFCLKKLILLSLVSNEVNPNYSTSFYYRNIIKQPTTKKKKKPLMVNARVSEKIKYKLQLHRLNIRGSSISLSCNKRNDHDHRSNANHVLRTVKYFWGIITPSFVVIAIRLLKTA